MIVVKDPAGAFGCYIVTIIPDEANATKSSLLAAKMFDSGDQHTTFSGTTFYTILGSNNYPVAAERYIYGERYAAVSWWWETSSDEWQLEEKLTALVGAKKLYAHKKTMNKSDEFIIGMTQTSGGMSFQNSGGGSSNSSGSTSSSPPTTPMSPVDQGYYNASVNSLSPSSTSSNGAPSGIYSGGGGGSSASPSNLGTNSSSSTTNSNSATSLTPRDYRPTTNDKFFRNIDVPRMKVTQSSEWNCVPYMMSYTNRLFGGNKSSWDCIKDLKKMKIKTNSGGVLPRKTFQMAKTYFKIEEDFSVIPERVDNSLGRNLSYKTIINDLKCVVMVPIPIGTQTIDGKQKTVVHIVVVVGYKDNGDLIYVDPAKDQLQEVNPNYVFDHIYKLVISGNR